MSDEGPSVQQLFDLSGRVALVTGATGYLGSAMAEALAESGCRVVLASRDLAKAQAAAKQLAEHSGQEHLAVAIDHLDESSVERGFTTAVELASRVDILVNNGHEALAADWRDVGGEQFTRQLSNATGYFLLARKMRDHAVGRNAPASIIMLGSMYGLVASYPDAYAGLGPASPAAYHALKGGIIHLTRHLAVYWAPDGVRVNCLSPGPFPQPTVSRELVARLDERSPMGRMGQPHELKGAILFLASDASSYVTGHNLVVDGGWTAW
jgi:NAD(P)-dependent dehydrogenase (short-subunit alcohol dehydrogenase family)